MELAPSRKVQFEKRGCLGGGEDGPVLNENEGNTAGIIGTLTKTTWLVTHGRGEGKIEKKEGRWKVPRFRGLWEARMLRRKGIFTG